MTEETQDKTQLKEEKKDPKKIAKERIDKIIANSKKSDQITYEEFEKFADIAKEFIVNAKLFENKDKSLFGSLDIIKKDREGFFNMVSYITNTNPEVLKTLPMYQLMDYLYITENFLSGVRLFDFFTCTTTILTRLIVV